MKESTNFFMQAGQQFFTDFDQMINFLNSNMPVNEFIKCLEETKKQGYKITLVGIGKKGDLPPSGYARIYGSEIDWNELVLLEDLDKRIAEIMKQHEDEDYYTTIKFLWLKYDDGNKEQMAARFYKD